LRVEGVELDASGIESLRLETAWVDPAVSLWNRSFLENIRYGAPSNGSLALSGAIEGAGLRDVLQRLPDGLQTALGEGGALVSGGEGQRVRIARALLRTDARLVILDEAFRGLDRHHRRALLERCREAWREATLFFVSHDIRDTTSFPRVLVVDSGRIVEDAAPQELLETASRYRDLLEAEEAVRREFWSSGGWRRMRVEGGRLRETGAEESA
jgi:ATP-binding cassette subfamily B protein